MRDLFLIKDPNFVAFHCHMSELFSSETFDNKKTPQKSIYPKQALDGKRTTASQNILGEDAYKIIR